MKSKRCRSVILFVVCSIWLTLSVYSYQSTTIILQLENSTIASGVAMNIIYRVVPCFVRKNNDINADRRLTLDTVLDVGQQEAETFAREMLSERNPAYNLMKKMHGMAIVWEHRYYGKSWHMKITTESQAHDMRYLTLEQSLNDVKIFAKRFRRPNLPKVEVHSAAVPWVFVGGDYAGLRAVRMRQLHPDTIFASYAATAPLLANLDWKGPSELLPKFMNAVGLDSCVEMIEGAIKLLDYILSQEDQDDALKVKEKFLGPAAKTGSNEQFVGIVEAFASIWISAANFDPHKSGYMADFCKFVSLTPEEIRKSRNPRARYWPRTRDWIVLLKWAQHPFIAWQANFQPFLKAAYSGEVQVNYKLGAKLEDMDAISREWQACTEIGVYIVLCYVKFREVLTVFSELGSRSCSIHFQVSHNQVRFIAV